MNFKLDKNSNQIFEFRGYLLIMNRSLIDDKLFFDRQIAEESQSTKYEQFYSNYEESEVSDMQSILSRQRKILKKIKVIEDKERN